MIRKWVSPFLSAVFISGPFHERNKIGLKTRWVLPGGEKRRTLLY